MSKRVVMVTAVTALAGSSGPVLAHHPTAGPAPQRTADAGDQRTRAGFAVSATEVDTPAASGRFVTAEADLSLAVGAGFAVRLRLPVHDVDGAGFERATGPGDVALGVGWGAGLGGRWSVATVADVLLPTGDADRGLGYGTAALAAHVRFERRFDGGWRATVAAGGIANASPAASGIAAEQRADAEVRAGAGAAWGRGRWLARLDVLAAVPVLADEQSVRGTAFLTARPAVEVEVGSLWLRAFGGVPLRSTRRIDWHFGAGVAVAWDAAPSNPGPALPLARSSY